MDPDGSLQDDWQLEYTHSSVLGEVSWGRFGDPEGEPVVLLHGTPFSSYIWRDIAGGLAQHRRVYVWDMPGYGASDRFEGQDLSLGTLAQVFADLLSHWDLREPAVVAHNSGGAVALGALLEGGVRYRRLALVDAVALAPWGSSFFEVVGEHTQLFARLPPKLHGGLLREYVNSASSPGLHSTTLERLAKPWLDEHGQAAFYRQLGQRMNDQDYTQELQRRYDTIQVPVLVCWGGDDTWIPLDRGRELADRIRNASFRVILGAGHLIQEDRPAELTATLIDFLDEPD